MWQECRERFPRHRLQRKPLVSYLGMHHDTCVTHVPWCMSGSLTRITGETVPGITDACATRNFYVSIKRPIPIAWIHMQNLTVKLWHKRVLIKVNMTYKPASIALCLTNKWNAPREKMCQKQNTTAATTIVPKASTDDSLAYSNLSCHAKPIRWWFATFLNKI